VCLLGSATPSLESFLNAQTGKYRLVELKQRVDARKLPFIDIVDLRVEAMKQRSLPLLSGRLVRAMQDRFEKREQTILFINRRGYSSSMLCTKCGHTEECLHCSIALTYHRSDETLRCHLCGAQKPAPLRCPKCAQPDIRWKGLGTQRIEEAVRRVLPRAKIERMDTDTMSKKNRFREVLSAFRAGKVDVLVGTQMIGKGLDFPNVTLVGLVDADMSMHVPDFRANERTFQLLVQVAGRAGRGDRAGEVVVQTFTPQAEAIQFSRHADFAGFAASELKVRKDFHYPPYRHLIHHLFRGPIRRNSSSSPSSGRSWSRKRWASAWSCAGRRRRRSRKSKTSIGGSSGISPTRSRRSCRNWRSCARALRGRTTSRR
jgi:primosomal protein N' (replication factor Y)